MKERLFEEAVIYGMESGDWKTLESWITQESSFTYNYGSTAEDEPFSEALYKIILSLLQQKEFLLSEGSSNVLRFLEYDWSLMSNIQKSNLLPILEEAYPKFKDPLSWFIVCEILGEYLCDEKALESLCRLKKVDVEEARSLIPMGLVLIIKNSHNKVLSEMAYAALTQMRDDSSEQVRHEVENFLPRRESLRTSEGTRKRKK